MEHKFPLGSFHRENGTTFSEVPLFPGIFQWNKPKNHVPFTTQPEFPESLGKWKTPSVSSLMYITGAKFEDHCFNISGDILDSVFYCLCETIYDVITFLICIIQKCEYL